MRLRVKTVGIGISALIIICSFPLFPELAPGGNPGSHDSALAAGEVYKATGEPSEEPVTIDDPFQDLNRAFFTFNDRLYFWFLKPMGRVYAVIVPEGVRIGIRNMFDNVVYPSRGINNLLQGKGRGFRIETARFVINSTLGVGGFFDIAKTHFSLEQHDEDLGQTLGFYGVKPGFYIDFPVFGPSSLRDGIGMVGDTFMNPVFWLTPNWKVSAGIRMGETTNEVSLRIGEYEDFKSSALDPYISLRDAYLQYREAKIKQ